MRGGSVTVARRRIAGGVQRFDAAGWRLRSRTDRSATDPCRRARRRDRSARGARCRDRARPGRASAARAGGGATLADAVEVDVELVVRQTRRTRVDRGARGAAPARSTISVGLRVGLQGGEQRRRRDRGRRRSARRWLVRPIGSAHDARPSSAGISFASAGSRPSRCLASAHGTPFCSPRARAASSNSTRPLAIEERAQPAIGLLLGDHAGQDRFAGASSARPAAPRCACARSVCHGSL